MLAFGYDEFSEGPYGNLKAVYWNKGVARDLGSLDPGSIHLPRFVNDGQLVIGNYFSPWSSQHGRVFSWHDCIEKTPSLDDWTVTYVTDKNPSWSFEVEVGDVCTTNISNQAEITTTTPETNYSNNASRTSISVNTADLAAYTYLWNSVVGPPDSIDGDLILWEAWIENLGPGPARDVEVVITLPENCFLEDWDYDDEYYDEQTHEWRDLLVTDEYVDDFRGELHRTYAELPAGAEPYYELACWNGVYEVGSVLQTSIVVSSPTIDCDAGNDRDDDTIIVGPYPDLLVELFGPESTSVGTTTYYELEFGNFGNHDTNGTIELTVPPGATFELDCYHGESNDPDYCQCDWNQDAQRNAFVKVDLSTPGKVIFTPDDLGFWGNQPSNNESTWGYYDWGYWCGIDFSLTWELCEDGGQQHTLVAEAFPDRPDADLANNRAAVTTTVSGPAGQLEVVVDRSDTAAEVGKDFFYTLHFANNGRQAATGTMLVVTLPSGLELVSALPDDVESDTPGTLQIPVGRTTVGQDGGAASRYLLPGDAGSTVLLVRVRPGTITSAPGSVQLVADAGACEVASPIPGPTILAPNTGLHVIVSSSHGSSCAKDLDTIEWTVTVTNPDPANEAKLVPVFVNVPAGLTFIPGTMTGQNPVQDQAPTLLWIASIPPEGVINLTFQTRLVAADGVVAVTASARGNQGAGTVIANCEERVVVNKSWALNCGATGLDCDSNGQNCDTSGRTYSVTLTVRNRTQRVFLGSLSDAFQAGVEPKKYGAAAWDSARRLLVWNNIMLTPGMTVTRTFKIDVSQALFGDPLFDRAVFESETAVAVASNQVVGGVANCGDTTYCELNSCDFVDGCRSELLHLDTPELCNAVDDDCDSQTDEGFGLLVGQTVLPLDAACDGEDSDVCKTGTVICNDDENGTECSDPSDDSVVEVCNGVDDDCNGNIDEQDLTLGVGDPAVHCDGADAGWCRDGSLLCNPALVQNPALEPRTICYEVSAGDFETCDGEDETCDCDAPDAPGGCIATVANGMVDEGFEIGLACMTDELGICRRDGTLQCDDDNATSSCHPTTLDPTTAELCNLADDDCDGDIDETWPELGTACDSLGDADLCKGGLWECNNDQNGTVCVGDDTNRIEVCNGVDDDCDGDIDEEDLARGVGDPNVHCDGGDADVCQEGSVLCNPALVSNPALEPKTLCLELGPVHVELCGNTVDDDCDGLIDEGFPGLGSDCDSDPNDTDLCKNDVVVCSGAGTTCEERVTAKTELCNTLDDDCDGSTDEGFPGLGGACDSDPNDTDLCNNDLVVCNGDGSGTTCRQEVAGQIEKCNSMDDDCDGLADETFANLGQPCDGTDGDLCNGGFIECNDDENDTLCSDDATSIAELCNYRDDDCDGATDELPNGEGFYTFDGLALGAACDGDDNGTCLNGVVTCSGNGAAAFCLDIGVDPSPIGCSLGLGECKRNGYLGCDFKCNAAVVTGSTEVCGDGLDNNCDGATDEGFPGLGGACDSDPSDTDLCKNDLVVCDGTGTACDKRSRDRSRSATARTTTATVSPTRLRQPRPGPATAPTATAATAASSSAMTTRTTRPAATTRPASPSSATTATTTATARPTSSRTARASTRSAAWRSAPPATATTTAPAPTAS